jgi:hypothetical protein
MGSPLPTSTYAISLPRTRRGFFILMASSSVAEGRLLNWFSMDMRNEISVFLDRGDYRQTLPLTLRQREHPHPEQRHWSGVGVLN